MKDTILKIMAGFDLDAAIRPAIEAAYAAGVRSTQCYLFARPRPDWICIHGSCTNPATCFSLGEVVTIQTSCDQHCNHDHDEDGQCLPVGAVPEWWPKAADGTLMWVQVHEDGGSWSLVPGGTSPDVHQVIALGDVVHTEAEFCDIMEMPFDFRQESLDA